MKAIILAGGLGTRLRPLTSTCPKPLLPVGNLPIISRIILALRRQNIREFVFLLHYQPELIMKTLGEGKAFDAVFQYECLAKDLSTAGSVKFIANKIQETCLIFSADILAELPVESMLQFHRERNALVTIALQAMPAPLPFGIVLRGQNGKIKRFLEKPTWPQVYGDWINASIYIIEPELVNHIPNHGNPAFFEKEVFPPLAKGGEAIYGFPLSGYWRDVGTPEDLREANLDLLRGKLPEDMLTEAERENIRRGEQMAFLSGESTKIAPDATLQDVIVGNSCRISAGVKIFRSVLMDKVTIKAGASLEGAILMPGVRIGARATLHEDTLIGAGAKLGTDALVNRNGVVRQNRKIAAHKTVAALKVLPSGYIRRFVDGGSLLGSGADNFSCDFMRWVGKAFGHNQRIACQSRRRKRLHSKKLLLATASREVLGFWLAPLAEGMNHSGCDVHLLYDVTLPMTRRVLLKGEYAGGIYLGLDDSSGLLRLALLYSTGEDFSTAEACGLERIDTFDEALTGQQHTLNESEVREEYLNTMFNSSQLRKPATDSRDITIGVVGNASEKITKLFFKKLQWPVEILTLPLEIDADFRERTLAFQRSLAPACHASARFAFFIGAIGERIRLVLPRMALSQFSVSDIALARLLAKQKEPNRNLLEGWLMPEISNHTQAESRLPSVQISGMNSIMASLARAQDFDSWYGFDGYGGVTVSEWLNYHDALMALAHILHHATEENYRLCVDTARKYSTAYHLVTCPDHAKAQVMRRLIESFEETGCEVHDGVKFKLSSGWVMVRLCAGREALEVFKYECKARAHEGDRSPVHLLMEQVLACLGLWINDVKRMTLSRL